MTKLFSLIALFAICLTVNAGEFERKVEGFSTITIIGNYKAKLIKSDEEKVVVTNNDEEVEDDDILTEVKKGELKVRIKNDIFKVRDITVVVYFKDVNEFKSKKGCLVTCEDLIETEDLILYAGNGGKVRVQSSCKTADLMISGGGSINFSGSANSAEYKITTGGTIDAVNAEVKDLTCKISAGGDIRCRATEKMFNQVTTGGTINYKFSGEDSAYEEKISLGGTIKKIKE